MQTSPTMSSYLLFFAVGDFEPDFEKSGRARGRDRHLERGNGAKAQFALDAEARSSLLPNNYCSVSTSRYPSSIMSPVPASRNSSGRWRIGRAIFTFEKILLLEPGDHQRDRPPGDFQRRGA